MIIWINVPDLQNVIVLTSPGFVAEIVYPKKVVSFDNSKFEKEKKHKCQNTITLTKNHYNFLKIH